MIEFNKMSKEAPYIVFKDFYRDSLEADQKNIEAICIASYSSENKEVHARFVNLKFVNDNKFIFFSNYNSPKSQHFYSHKQIIPFFYEKRVHNPS